ncbi:MAG: hypothetical protein NVS3B14_04960 [Ktedonobacteraceae bacterium]
MTRWAGRSLSNGLGVPPMPEFHQQVTAYIASLPSPQLEICQALRELILEHFPHMREAFKWNSPAYYYHGKRICLTSGFKDHVTLELFYGAHLQDAQERIVGVGKNTRHMKLKSLEEIDPTNFVNLLQQSIELSQAGTST